VSRGCGFSSRMWGTTLLTEKPRLFPRNVDYRPDRRHEGLLARRTIRRLPLAHRRLQSPSRRHRVPQPPRRPRTPRERHRVYIHCRPWTRRTTSNSIIFYLRLEYLELTHLFFVSQWTLSGANPTPLSIPKSTPDSLNFLESVEAAHSSHSFNDRVSALLNITRPPTRMDSQAKYGCLARGDGGAYLRMPTGVGYKEKIWVCLL